ncbi:MAG: flagellar hook-associated protein FlgK [Pseudomonadota bacterium]
MGLASALTSALSGLQVVEQGISTASRNVANADTPGYTRKTAVQSANVTGSETLGVNFEGLRRETSELLLSEIQAERTRYGFAATSAAFYEQIDLLYGAPGSSGALDSIFNDFKAGLQALTTTPESPAIQVQTVSDAQVLAQRLNALSDSVQAMRGDAEQQLSDAVTTVNNLLEDLESVNQSIVNSGVARRSAPDLLDRQDQILGELSSYLDLTVIRRVDQSVAIYTASGARLLDGERATLSFDRRANINEQALYSNDPAERGVGTVSIIGEGFEIDLIRDGALRGGVFGGLIEMRDDTLVEAQRQLDEFAAALSRSFSDVPINGTAANDGAGATGFDIDLSGLLPGDSATVTVEISGTPQVFTFVRADDAAGYPLSNDLTARQDDTVIGLNFTTGLASLDDQIQAALGADFAVSDQGGGTVRILDDGAVGNSNVVSAAAVRTATGITGSGSSLPLFIDPGAGSSVYSGSVDGTEQLNGFARRITLNTQIAADPTGLIISQTTPETPIGDPTRPRELLDRLNAPETTFSEQTGVSGTRSLTTSVSDFLRDFIGQKTGEANLARGDAQAAEDILVSLEDRYSSETGVSIDEELALLVNLQNTYAANARIISVVDELFDQLLSIS